MLLSYYDCASVKNSIWYALGNVHAGILIACERTSKSE